MSLALTTVRPLFQALLLTACCAAQAIDLPATPQDPRLAATLKQAHVLLTAASSPGYMDFPAATPWPCEVSELQLRKMVGAVTEAEQDERMRSAIRNSFMNAGMRDSEMKTSILDVRIAPIAALCANGRLDGPLEFMLEFTRVLDMPTASTETRSRSRFQGLARAGERIQTSPSATATQTLSNRTTYKDAATQKLMANIKVPDMRSLIATVTEPVDEMVGYSATIQQLQMGGASPEWTTMLNRPTGARSMEMHSYRGASLWTRNSTRNWKLHGEWVMYPFTINGTTVPGSSKCYEDGEEIKTTQCTVD